MKRILSFVLALVMVLSLAACGSKSDDSSGKTVVDMTAQKIMDTLKEKLGDSLLGTGYGASGKLGIYEQFQFRSQFQLRCYC